MNEAGKHQLVSGVLHFKPMRNNVRSKVKKRIRKKGGRLKSEGEEHGMDTCMVITKLKAEKSNICRPKYSLSIGTSTFGPSSVVCVVVLLLVRSSSSEV